MTSGNKSYPLTVEPAESSTCVVKAGEGGNVNVALTITGHWETLLKSEFILKLCLRSGLKYKYKKTATSPC